MSKKTAAMGVTSRESSPLARPLTHATPATFPSRPRDINEPVRHLETVIATEKRPTRQSAPLVVHFDSSESDESSPVTPEFARRKPRRLLSDPVQSTRQLSDEEDYGPPLDHCVDFEVPPIHEGEIEEETPEWGTFVEAPRWEDWQEFAMHGAFKPPAVLDNEDDALKRLELLSPYLPRMLAHTALYDSDIPLGETPSIQSVIGAVMIADITGFTMLTERALTSKRGNELVEELTGCMNNYFDEALELVLEYGGDTIKYAGDSIIVFFPVHLASNETQASCALRAVACGFDLISCLGAYTPELGGYGNSEYDHDGAKRDSTVPRTASVSRSLSSRGLREKEGSDLVTILIVDDIMLNRVVLGNMLSKLNCAVALAANGREAVKAHSKQHFDAIFMDVHMPLLDGIGASHLIRRGRSKTPIIGVSSRVDEQLRKECLAAGMDDLLSKPVTMSQLVTLLRFLRASRTNQNNEQSPSKNSISQMKAIKETMHSEARMSAVPSKGPVRFETPPRYRKSSPTARIREASPMDKDGKRLPKGSSTESVMGPSLQGPPSADSVPDASLTLALKVLIGTGKVCMLSVGGGLQMPSGLPRWEYFMADMPAPLGNHSRHPMEQLRCCEEHANSGNVILSPEVWALVGKQCEGELLEGGFVRLSHVVGRVFKPPPQQDSFEVKRVPMTVHILKRYLPELLRSKIEAAEGIDSSVRAEVRHVTCLFLGFPSLSQVEANESVLLDSVQKAMLTVQQSLRLFDGLLVQFRMDEKGYVMICAFGLPGNLHEDDPKRGVQTALDAHEKLRALGQKADIGVATGKLLCTVVGGKKRCEYTVFGNCINLSARLMKKATNEVLIDTDTYRMTSDVLEAVALPPMAVKGRTGLLKVYRVVNLKGAISPGDRSSLSKSFPSPIASPKEFENILCSTTFGRKVEMDAAITKIEAFLSRESDKKLGVVHSVGAAHGVLMGIQTPGFESSVHPGPSGVGSSSNPAEVPSVKTLETVAEAGLPCTAIVVTGHAGIGKSKLLESLTCHMKDLPVQILLTGTELVNNNTLVFGPWVKLLLELLCFDPESSEEERGTVILKILDAESRQHAHLLKDILKIKIKAHAARNSSQMEPRRKRIFRHSMSEQVSRSPDNSGQVAQASRISFLAQLAAQGVSFLSKRNPNEGLVASFVQSNPLPTPAESLPINDNSETQSLRRDLVQIESASLSEASTDKNTNLVPVELSPASQSSTNLLANTVLSDSPSTLETATNLPIDIGLSDLPSTLETSTDLRTHIGLTESPSASETSTSLHTEIGLSDSPSTLELSTNLHTDFGLSDSPNTSETSTNLQTDIGLSESPSTLETSATLHNDIELGAVPKTSQDLCLDLQLGDLPSISETLTNSQTLDLSEVPKQKTQTWKRHSVDHGVLLRHTNELVQQQETITPPRLSGAWRRRSTGFPGKEDSIEASPEISMQRVAKLIEELILALVKRPCVIFIEDAHLMDNPSWSILKQISENKESGTLLIAACRPWGAHAPKEYTSLVQADTTLFINLRELNEKSTQAFVRQTICQALGGYTELPPQIFQVIYSRTQGHPLFSEQMAIALVEMRVVIAGSPEDTVKRLATFELEKFNFSSSMEALITSRVDLLDANQALTLKVASVIGLNFSIDPLLSVLNQQLQREGAPVFNMQQLEAALGGLDKLNFLNHRPNKHDGAFSFSNLVTRDATYGMLPVKQRRMIHADIAKELLKQGTSGVRCVKIAHHYTMACKDVEEMEVSLTAIAIDHWEEAGSCALFKFGEYELAIQYYLSAIALGDLVLEHINQQRLATWHHYLARAYAAVGDIDNSGNHTILALKYTGEQVSDDLALYQKRTVCCSAILEPGIRAWKTYCHRRLLNWILYITGKGENSRECILRCEALAQLTALAVCKEEMRSAKKLSARYLVVAGETSSSHPLEVARAYSLAALVTTSALLAKYHCFKCMEGLRLQEKSQHQAVQAGDIHYNLAVMCLFQGRWNKAEKHASKALTIYAASQGRREVDLCRCLIALGQLYQGQYENCHQEGVRLLAYRQEHPQLRIWAIFLVVASLNSMKCYQDSAKALAQLQDVSCSVPSLALQVKALGWETAMCLNGNEGVQDVLALIPQLISMTPLTAIFPKALAAAAEVLLTSLELHKMSELQRVAREEVMQLLLDCMKSAANRIGLT